MAIHTMNIIDLANSLVKNTKKYHEYLLAKDLPLPSHDSPSLSRDDISSLPEEIADARETALEATHELGELIAGPTQLILNSGAESSKILCLHFIHQNKIANLFLWDNTMTFKEIADKSQLDEDDTRRMLRLAMTHHIFKEPTSGSVAHTAASWELATNKYLAAWVGVMSQENWTLQPHIVEAMKKWPGSQDPLETAYSLANNTHELPFVALNRDPERVRQFADAMTFIHSDKGFEPELLIEGFDFGSYKSGVFVDVGGSDGQVCIKLARRHPQFKCIVQDMPATVEVGKERLPEDIKDRVSFMAHDFWTEQPVKDADIFHFRWVFHDWPDSHCVKLLRCFIPVLKKGAKILINDICLPPPGFLPPYKEQLLRGIDITMKSFMNAKERDANDWVQLFTQADPRFKFVGITVPPKAKCAIIEAEWA